MKKTNCFTNFLPFAFCLFTIVLASCSPVSANSSPTPATLSSEQPTEEVLQPTATVKPLSTWPAPTPYYSAPRDEVLDTACRITINLFFSYKQGDDPQFYKGLFTKDAEYRADGIVPSPDTAMILDLLPASEQWLRDFPDTPMPGTILPTKPNEYIYYVKFTSINRQQPGIHITSQSFLPPDFMNITMVADPNTAITCKILNYGKG